MEETSPDSLNDSTISIDTPPTKYPPNTYGWVNHRHIVLAEEVHDDSWNLRWLAVESGLFFWYLNDMMGMPEGFKQLKGLDIQYTEAADEESIVIKMKDLSEIHEFEIAKSNAQIWKIVIEQNKELDAAVSSLSLADYRMEDVDTAVPASMQIQLKGSPHTLTVGPDDDTAKMTDEFVMKHNLKSDIKPKIESELLRTQVDSCLAYQNKLRCQVGHLRRLVIESSLYEPRALAAESLAARTSDELRGLAEISKEITVKMTSLRGECDEKNKDIAELTSNLLKEQTAMEQYRVSSQLQLSTCQAEIERLQNVIKSLKASTGKKTDVSLDESVLQEAIDEIETKSEQIRQQEIRLKDLESANEKLKFERDKLDENYKECLQANSTIRQQLEDQKLSEHRNIANLKEKIHQHEEDMRVLRKKLKMATDKVDVSLISEQLNDSKIKKLSEDYQRLLTSNQNLKGKLELNSRGYEASRQENKGLQDLLRVKDSELQTFKNQSSAKLLRSVIEENTMLKDQCIRLRGEVIELQAKIDDVKNSALSAVQSMQLLNAKDTAGNSPHHSNRAGKLNTEQDVIVEVFVEEDSSTGMNTENTPNNKIRDGAIGIESEMDTDIEIDFKLDQSTVVDERSAAALSPIVEDRLLRNIFCNYTTETSEQLTLTRFGRFTKEFKIAGLVKAAERFTPSGVKKTDAMLVYGDVDVVFMNTVKNVPAKEIDGPMNISPTRSKPPNAKSPQTFHPGGGKIHSPRSTTTTQIKGSHLTANQFIAAVQELAVRLYSNVIEEKTGTVLECLPEKQKKMAMRAAMDVMVLKKLMPHASTLGLVPWELISLDQTLTTLHSNDVASKSLVSHVSKVSGWFMHYSKDIEINIFNDSTKSRQSLPGQIASSPLSSIGSPGFIVGNSRHSFSGSRGHIIDAPQKLTFRGIAYKALSKFFHDYGVIPYLIKDPQLFSMFTEVNLWSKGNVELLLTALPEKVISMPAVSSEMSNPPQVREKLAKKKVLLCGSFFVLFAAIANQAFEDIPTENRVGRLFEWTAQSGGSYLMQKKT